MGMTNIGAMVRGYLEAAIWSSLYEDGTDHPIPLDRIAEKAGAEWSPEAVKSAQGDCAAFLARIAERFGEAVAEAVHRVDPSHLGHDFWLMRNRHGAGFWDGNYTADFCTDPRHETPCGPLPCMACRIDGCAPAKREKLGDLLTEIAHGFGELHPYIDDGDLIRLMEG